VRIFPDCFIALESSAPKYFVLRRRYCRPKNHSI